MNITCASPIRDTLRDATRAAHDRLDAAFAHGLPTVRDYRVYLRGMHAFARGVDGLLGGSGPPWAGWASPARVAALATDLEALSCRALPPDAVAMPAPPVRGAAGLVYVVEGSALGGRMLLRDATRLGFTRDRGAAFLHAHGGEHGRERWRRFLALLAEAAPGSDDEDGPRRDLVQSARDAFAFAGACFAHAAASEASAP